MEASSNIFQTMQSLMAIKTKELAKKRDSCRTLRQELTQPLEEELDPRQRVKLLLGDIGTKVYPEAGKIRRKDLGPLEEKIGSTQQSEILELAGLSAANVQRLLDQSVHDTAIPPTLFTSIENKFIAALTAKEIKYKFATLFTALVNDASPGRSGFNTISAEPNSPTTPPSDYESVGRSAMHEQREVWESRVFKANEVDEAAVKEALEKAFSSKQASQSLYELRKSMKSFCKTMLLPDRIDTYDVKACINGLISSDLLSQEQNDMLKEIRGKDEYLTELSDVLNLRITDLDSWSWNTEAMPVEMRRQLNGKYRFFTHEEVTQALFIYFIGLKFSIELRDSFSDFYHSKGWTKPMEIQQNERKLYEHHIGDRAKRGPSIEQQLDKKFISDYFMTILPANMEEEEGDYSAEDASNKDASTSSRSVDAKQGIVHLLKTEAILAQQTGKSLYVTQTDFRWFGPSLSHTTIAATMRHLGVTDEWLRFFDKFLKAPLRFVHDGPNGQIRTRQCGVPMSHMISTMFGEAVMFCLDFVVNEATGGRPMFRLHDDIWIWGSQSQCSAAWKALTDVIAVLGLQINEEKTGSACLAHAPGDEEGGSASNLPSGKIKWGFLEMREGAEVSMDEEAIATHTGEFRRQLEAQGSIMSWVRAYNAYSRFISFNLCQPANCLGLQHVDASLAVFARVHRELFLETNGSVAEHLKRALRDQYGVDDVPDGFIYLPLDFGGLGVRNPCIPLINMRSAVDPEPQVILREALEDHRLEYERLQELYQRQGPAKSDKLAEDPDFLSYDEYFAFYRNRDAIIGEAYASLMSPATEQPLEARTEVTKLMAQLPAGYEYKQFRSWQKLTPYWQAVFDMYGGQMAEQFGGLEVVGRNLLPLGMVKLLKGKVRWES